MRVYPETNNKQPKKKNKQTKRYTHRLRNSKLYLLMTCAVNTPALPLCNFHSLDSKSFPHLLSLAFSNYINALSSENHSSNLSSLFFCLLSANLSCTCLHVLYNKIKFWLKKDIQKSEISCIYCLFE